MISAVLMVFLSQAGRVTVRDEGATIGTVTAFNCSGAGITCTVTGNQATVSVSGGGAANYQTVQDEGSNLTQRATINFTGAGVSCADNGGSSRTDCTIAGGGTTHDIISATHTDTTGTPAQGDILYRNGSSQWTRLAAGSSTQLLHSGTTPSWSSAAKADLPSTIAYEDEANTYGATNIQKLTRLQFQEQSDPSAPPASTGELYSADRFGRTVLRFKNQLSFPLQLAQDRVVVVRNQTGTTIPIFSTVYESGTGGSGEPLVALGDADLDSAMPVIGITMEAIANNANGFVMIEGVLQGVNTTGFSVGDIIYVSQTPGAFTTTPPSHPALRQRIARILTSASSGTALVTSFGVRGDHLGTNQNQWLVGDAAAGSKDIVFKNTNSLTLRASPTATRTVTLPDSTVSLAGVAGQLGGTAESPDVRGVRESGGTLLTMGAVSDGQYLQRSGTSLIGGTPAGGAGNYAEVTLTFNASGGAASTVVTGQSWVGATSKILCTPFNDGSVSNNTDEVYQLALISHVVSTRVVGTGFTLSAFSPTGISGDFKFHCTGG